MPSTAQNVVHFLRYFDTFALATVAAYVWGRELLTGRWDLALVLYLVPVSASLLRYYGLYESHRVEGKRQLVRSLLSAQVAGLALALLVVFLAGIARFAMPVVLYFAISSAILFGTRIALYWGLAWARSNGFDRRKVCFIGMSETASQLSARFRGHPSWGLDLAYCAVPPAEGVVGPESSMVVEKFGSSIKVAVDLESLLRSHPVEEVVIATDARRIEDFRPLLAICHQSGIPARLMLEGSPDAIPEPAGSQLEHFAGSLSLAVPGRAHDASSLLLKRLIDGVVSVALLIFLAPLLALIAIMVKLSSPGPVFFRQERMGRYGRVFSMLKFRTMVDGADGLLSAVAARNITNGPAFKMRGDWRITPAGRWLRRFSIDELPQLVNVLTGEMSLVGPRPLPVHEALQISGAYRRRFSVRPGITCLWQVNGRSEVPFGRWMTMDLEYVDQWSLWLDTKLLVRTIPAVLSGRGAY